MSVKVTKNFKPLVPFIVKKPLKSARNNMSLDGAKKKNFWSQSIILDKFLIKIFSLKYSNIFIF